MQETMQIEIVENHEIEQILTTSNLETADKEEIKKSYFPFLEQMKLIREEAIKINFIAPTLLDEKIARDLRLRTVKIRTGSELVKDDRKRIHQLRANVEQQEWNLIKSKCQLAEESFLQIEKKREIIEAKRKDELKKERIEMLDGLTEYAELYPLGEMNQDAFENLLSGLKLAKQAKIDADNKAIEALAEKVRIDKLHTERKNSILNHWQFLPETRKTVNFGELTDEQWELELSEISQRKKSHDAEQEKIRLENEALKIREREREEQKKIAEALQSKRLEELLPYTNIATDSGKINMATLWQLTEKDFSVILSNRKIKFDKLQLEAKQFAEEKQKQEALQAEIKKQRNAEMQPYVVFIRDYNAMLNLGTDEYIQELEEVKKGAELQWESDRKESQKAAKAKAEADAKLKAERGGREAAEAKLRADQIAKEKTESERLAAERKLSRSSEKVKLKAWIDSITIIGIGTAKLKPESIEIANEIFARFESFKKWAREKIEEL